ncbi:hypothetical protein [Nonomuraea sp. NPDC046570]|uniref:hypothetical protein n=1 Tax=Nonomuraea sp. NPDC046570 TaxID=3155255 RepID=UPI00340F8AA0
MVEASCPGFMPYVDLTLAAPAPVLAPVPAPVYVVAECVAHAQGAAALREGGGVAGGARGELDDLALAR